MWLKLRKLNQGYIGMRFTWVILSALICSTVGAGPLAFAPDAFFSFCCLDAVILIDLEGNHHEIRQFLVPLNKNPATSHKQNKRLACVRFRRVASALSCHLSGSLSTKEKPAGFLLRVSCWRRHETQKSLWSSIKVKNPKYPLMF